MEISLGRLLHLSVPCGCCHSWECPSTLSLFGMPRLSGAAQGLVYNIINYLHGRKGPVLAFKHWMNTGWAEIGVPLLLISVLQELLDLVSKVLYPFISLGNMQIKDDTQLWKSSKILTCSLYCFSCFPSQMRESRAMLCNVLLLVLQKYLPFFSAFASNYWRCNFVLNEQLSTEP